MFVSHRKQTKRKIDMEFFVGVTVQVMFELFSAQRQTARKYFTANPNLLLTWILFNETFKFVADKKLKSRLHATLREESKVTCVVCNGDK